MAKEKDLALRKAMMADLGIQRVEELPMDDGNHGPSTRGPVTHHHNALQAQVGSRDGAPLTSRRPTGRTMNGPVGGVANIWQAAINGGAFDDMDAEAVKGLDDLGDETGRLYASRHSNGGMPTHPELQGRRAQAYRQNGGELPPSSLLRSDRRIAVSPLGIVQLDGDGPILSLNQHRGAIAAEQPRPIQAATPTTQQAVLQPVTAVTPNSRGQQVNIRPGVAKAQNPRPRHLVQSPSPGGPLAPSQPENFDHSNRTGTVIRKIPTNAVFEAPVSYVAQRRGKRESPGQVTLHQSRPPVAEKGIFRLFVVDKLFAEHIISDWHNFALDINQAMLTVRFKNRGKENTKPKENSKGEDTSLEYTMKFKSVDGPNGANSFLETVNSVWADQEVPFLRTKPAEPRVVKEPSAARAQSDALPVPHWQMRLAATADFDPFSVTIGSHSSASSVRGSTSAPKAESMKSAPVDRPANGPPAVQKLPPGSSATAEPTSSQQSSAGLRPPPGFAASPSLGGHSELILPPGSELKPPPGLKHPPGFGPSTSSTVPLGLTPPPGFGQTSVVAPTQTAEDALGVLQQIAVLHQQVSSSGEAKGSIDMTAIDAAEKLLQSLMVRPLASLGSGQALDARKKENAQARRFRYRADEMMAFRSNAVPPPHWLSELRFLPARSDAHRNVPRRPVSPMGWDSPTRPAPGIQEQINKILASAHELELHKQVLLSERDRSRADMSLDTQVAKESPSEPSSAGLSASKWADQVVRVEHANSFTGAPGAWPESSYMNDLMQLVIDAPADGLSANLEVAGTQESVDESACVLDAIGSFNAGVSREQAIPRITEQAPAPAPPVRGLRASRWCI